MPSSEKAIKIQGIINLLPQMQCTQCGYASCRAYATNIIESNAQINLCTPGGAVGVKRLADFLNREATPLHDDETPRLEARIDEESCVGCTICLKFCPVDAIIGARLKMHTVLPALCTGCGLCVKDCPQDCITMHNISGNKTAWEAWSIEEAQAAGKRYEIKLLRNKKEKDARATKKAARKHSANTQNVRKQAVAQAAIERARQRMKD